MVADLLAFELAAERNDGPDYPAARLVALDELAAVLDFAEARRLVQLDEEGRALGVVYARPFGAPGWRRYVLERLPNEPG